MGFSLNKYNTKVNIDLKSGSYIFSADSSTGKTRLYKLLKDMQKWGEPVISYSYGDYQYGVDLNSLVDRNQHAKIVMIDRYDMFNGVYNDTIASLAKDKIVMVDCKNNVRFTDDDKICFIEMDKYSIVVEE